MKRTIELTLEQAKEFYNKGGELKQIALLAYTESELLDNKKANLESYIRTQVIIDETTPIQKLSNDQWIEFWAIEHPMSIIYDMIEYFVDFWHRDYNWKLISSCQILTDEFIIEYYDNLDTELILLYQQQLSQETIDKIIENTKNDGAFWHYFWKENIKILDSQFIEKVNKGWNMDWGMISKSPYLTLDFIKKHKTELDLDLVVQYNNNVQPFLKVNELVGRRFCDVESLKDEIKKMFNTDDIGVVFVESDDIMIDDTIIITIDNIGLDITLYYILTKANYLYITETNIEIY